MEEVVPQLLHSLTAVGGGKLYTGPGWESGQQKATSKALKEDSAVSPSKFCLCSLCDGKGRTENREEKREGLERE